MAREFNQTFYKGEGATSNKPTHEIIEIDHKSGLQALSKGLAVTMYAMMLVILASKKSKHTDSLAWVYGIPNQYLTSNDSVRDMESFFDSTLINHDINPPRKYLVQNGFSSMKLKTDRLEVVAHIGSRMLSLGMQKKINVIFQLLKRALIWLRISVRKPVFLLIGPEYIVDLLAIELRRNQADDLFITTQTQILSPAIVFNSSIGTRTVMYWYSNNSIQISKKAPQKQDYSYLSQPRIAIHFVWSTSWGEILRKQNKESEILPIGPIIFKDLSCYIKKEVSKREKIEIVTIFDVTPKKFSGDAAFYSDSIMIKFIDDILLTLQARHLGTKIRLKPKRQYAVEDSLRYQKFLLSKSPEIEFINWNNNIVDEILKSDLVICIPFSSPALISNHLGIPSVFYSPSSDFKFEKTHEGISILQGPYELQKYLQKFEIN